MFLTLRSKTLEEFSGLVAGRYAVGIYAEGGFIMMTDTEIRMKGLKVLAEHLGDVEAERFIALIQREPFDYTKWRQGLDEDLSIEEISRKAMTLRTKDTEQGA